MSKVIDHAERRHAILSKARHLFAERGYDHVSMQEVAEVCGIARPILYKYFTDKRELFDSALAEMTQNIGQELAQSIVLNPKLTACDKLDLFLHKTIDLCLSNPALMRCIVEYLTTQRRQEKSVEKKIRRHTVTFRRTLRNLLLEGMTNGELRPFKISQAVDIIFSLMESMVIKIMFYDETDRELLFRNARNVIRALRVYSPLEEQNNG